MSMNWWTHRIDAPPMPDTIGDPKNFVLHAAEMQEYAEALRQMEDAAHKARVQAEYTLITLERGRLPLMGGGSPPVPITLSALLQTAVNVAKATLRIKRLMVAVCERRRQEQRGS